MWNYSSTNGNLFSWGQGQNGALGLSDTTQRSSPTQVGSGEDWESLGHQGRRYASGGGLKSDGTLWVWGRNSSGGLGQNDTIARSSPVQVPCTTWDKFSIGIDKGASIKTDGTLWVWGRNDAGDYAGALGQNNVVNYSSPVQIPGTTWATTSYQIGVGYFAVHAIKTDGTLWTWGYNVTAGQLGTGDAFDRSSPIQIPGTWKNGEGALNLGYDCMQAIKM